MQLKVFIFIQILILEAMFCYDKDKDYKFVLDLFNEHVLKFQGSSKHHHQQKPKAAVAPKLAIRGPPIIGKLIIINIL